MQLFFSGMLASFLALLAGMFAAMVLGLMGLLGGQGVSSVLSWLGMFTVAFFVMKTMGLAGYLKAQGGSGAYISFVIGATILPSLNALFVLPAGDMGMKVGAGIYLVAVMLGVGSSQVLMESK